MLGRLALQSLEAARELATAKGAPQRDSYYEPVAFELSEGDRSRPGDKAEFRLTPEGFGVEGKSEFNERGTSDEDNNEIQIQASQSSILAVNRLRRRGCNALGQLCRGSLRNRV